MGKIAKDGKFLHKAYWAQWVDSLEDADYEFGGEDYIITDEDIKLLKSGKILNFDVNAEYGCTLSYRKGEDHGNES